MPETTNRYDAETVLEVQLRHGFSTKQAIAHLDAIAGATDEENHDYAVACCQKQRGCTREQAEKIVKQVDVKAVAYAGRNGDVAAVRELLNAE
jgi:hypothetical protein